MIFSLMVGLTAPIGAQDIGLPPPKFQKDVTLYQTLQNRKSERSFSEKELSKQHLSNLLWAASGINRPESGKRTAPTARNAQEIDIYVALKAGLYLYDVKEHRLVLLDKTDLRGMTGTQDFVGTAPVNLIFVADYDRLRGSEESRKFYSATDTGFISQNVYLYCAAEGLATVVRGSVDREALAAAMKLRPSQHIILAQTIGYGK
ncbi:MAG: SagB/ThcOx family dehydrogenase [Fidelibacterota bacterium]